MAQVNAEFMVVETAFDNPHEFVPERWTTKRHMVKCPQAFSPFADGMSGACRMIEQGLRFLLPVF